MREYPSIQNSSKAPRKSCYVFDKLDGSNFRAKWTNKKGFCLYGTRSELIDLSTPFWSDMIVSFEPYKDKFHELFTKEFRNDREVIVYGEYVGENSFAGRHVETETREIVVFDFLVGHKHPKFLLPQDLVKLSEKHDFKLPELLEIGNLNTDLIKRIRENKDLKEGVICKGTERIGNYSGNVWMCKIKTQTYIDKLKSKFGDDWIKYGE